MENTSSQGRSIDGARGPWRWVAAVGILIVVVLTLQALVLALGGREVSWGSGNVGRLAFEDTGAIAAVLARRAMEEEVAERVTADELRQIMDRLRERAADGDPHAALVVFELARLQKVPGAGDLAPSETPDAAPAEAP